MPGKDRLLESGSIEPGHPFDSKPYRRALARFATGVIIVTAQHEGKTHGMTANAFISVSLDPPLVLVSVINRSNMHCMLQHTNHYGVSVLNQDQEILGRHFGVSMLVEDHENLSTHFASRPVDGRRSDSSSGTVYHCWTVAWPILLRRLWTRISSATTRSTSDELNISRPVKGDL